MTILNLGYYLDKIPDWGCIILIIILTLYYCQIIVGLTMMSNHLNYPKIKINNKIDEWSSIVWIPLWLYYVLLFTDKLKTNK